MTERMAKLDRAISLVHALSATAEGLTLDEMAAELGVNRRTAERLRAVIAVHFDLEEQMDDRRKRFRIVDSLRRVYTRPNAAEVAALQTEVEARRLEKSPQAEILASLLAKVRGALDDRERLRLDPDLEPLVRLQRSRVPAGPSVIADPQALAVAQGAIMAGACLEFEYLADGSDEAKWRRVVPYGLVHGPITYLIGKLPGRDAPPVPFRLDRMQDVRASNLQESPPEDWDLDAWMAQSFGIWREVDNDIILHVLPSAVARAKNWRFHPGQQFEELADGSLRVRFRAGGLREIAEHLFTWGGDVVIVGPEALKNVMAERLAAGLAIVNSKWGQA